jgi:hypothetical protein
MLTDPQTFTLNVDGLHEAHIEIIGGEGEIGGLPSISVGADQTREMRVLVRAGEEDDHEGEPASLEFQIRDIHDGRVAVARDFFRTPHSIH